jgi:nucleotide-binding universal stress UspA family protein
MRRVSIERILCPIDFSEFSRDALDHAVALATWYRAGLTVMHVIEVPHVPLDVGPGDAVALTPLPDRGKAAEELRAFARPAITRDDLPFEVVVTIGFPAPAIHAQAERGRADLVVLATRGRSGLQRFLLGSVAEKLLRSLPIPLLIVPPPVKKPETVVYETILCPIDFSDESLRALDYALSLAQESGARVILLHVLEGVLDGLDPEQVRNISVAEYLRNAEQDASERLRAAVPEEARVWAHPVERTARGRAYRQILAAAEYEKAGLIVMGVRGRGALNRMLFGSTTEHVIREARCPVLTLHAEIPVDRAASAGSTAVDASATADTELP